MTHLKIFLCLILCYCVNSEDLSKRPAILHSFMAESHVENGTYTTVVGSNLPILDQHQIAAFVEGTFNNTSVNAFNKTVAMVNYLNNKYPNVTNGVLIYTSGWVMYQKYYINVIHGGLYTTLYGV